MDEDRDQVPDLRSAGKQTNRRRNQNSSSGSGGSKDSGYAESSYPAAPVNFQPPSEIEIHGYFLGLSGKPELLARTSNEVFEVQYDGTYPRPKRIFNVGTHEIATMYDSARLAIHELLANVRWYSLDIVRIGYSKIAGDNPVVLLITVHPRTITYGNASKAVHGCQKILQDNGWNMEVEMKTGAIISNFDALKAGILKDPYDRIPKLGQSIGAETQGDQSAGTLSAYVKITGGPIGGKVYALTCDHVVFPKPEDSSKTLPFFDHVSTQRRYVQQPATLDHDALSAHLKNEGKLVTIELEKLLARQSAANEGTAKPLTEYQENQIAVLSKVLSETSRRLTVNNVFLRRFGYVIAASGKSSDLRREILKDWALIELDHNRFNVKPQNIMPDYDFSIGQVAVMNEFLDPKDGFSVYRPANEITELVTLDEVSNSRIMDTNGFYSFRVIKYGRTTGWTAGVVNEVRSDLQRASGEITKELCVINVPSDRDFTKAGDSGALVTDYNGRIVGVAHGGGFPADSGSGFSYFTPVEWLLEDMEATVQAQKIEFLQLEREI